MIAAKKPIEDELGQGPIWLSTDDILPAPENERLYRPVRSDDPEIIALADSIREHGIKEPLVISRDHFIHERSSPLHGRDHGCTP